MTAPNRNPIEYICGEEEEEQQLQLQFYQFVYGKELKSAAGYYMKHRLAGGYLKKNYFKKLPPLQQLTFSSHRLRLGGEMCRDALDNPRQLALHFHVRCIVNFAGQYLGRPGMTLVELLSYHQNDDFRSVARGLLDESSDIDLELLNSCFFGILVHWARQAYQLLMADELASGKMQRCAVLCWHAIAYLYNSRALVWAGRHFPRSGEIDYFETITSAERANPDYDGFYEQDQDSHLEVVLKNSKPLEEESEQPSFHDIPHFLQQTCNALTEKCYTGSEAEADVDAEGEPAHAALCSQPGEILSDLDALFGNTRYTDALQQWSEMMTPETINHQRGGVTRTVFTLVPTLLAKMGQSLKATADQFEVANISFPLPEYFSAAALDAIDYNQLYLVASDILPRLQMRSEVLGGMEKQMAELSQFVRSYCESYQSPESGQIPRPSVLRTMGALSQQVSDQLESFSRQWPGAVEQILAEHRFALGLTAEHQGSRETKVPINKSEYEKQQLELTTLRAGMDELRRCRDEDRSTIVELRQQLNQVTRERNTMQDVFRPQTRDIAPSAIIFKDVIQLLKQKATCAEILKLAEDLYGHRLCVLNSARESVQDLGLEHAVTVARQLQILVDDYLPSILAGQPDSVARKCFPTNVYSAKESATVAHSSSLSAERTFTYKNEEHYFEQHLKAGKNIRIHFILDQVDECVVIGHCGMHLSTQMTANQ